MIATRLTDLFVFLSYTVWFGVVVVRSAFQEATR